MAAGVTRAQSGGLAWRLVPRQGWRARPAAVLLHRWAGLVLAAFLVIAGLTGTPLAFHDELDAWLNPELSRVEIRDAPPLDPLTLVEIAEARDPRLQAGFIPIAPIEPGETYTLSVDARTDPLTGEPHPLGFSALVLDPYTGEVVGHRTDTLWPVTRENLMHVVFDLHHRLWIPGEWGPIIFGVAALVWTLDCFVGLYLTLPANRRRFWSDWGKSWSVKRGASAYRLNLDLHRAGGLWLWLLLLLFAWSGVAFNLYEPVYKPVMAQVLEFKPHPREAVEMRAEPLAQPALGWREARDIGRALMARAAAERGLMLKGEAHLSYDSGRGLYQYAATSDRDIDRKGGRTRVYFDGNTGADGGFYSATGEAAGDTVTRWLLSLHMAHTFGLWWQVVVALLGLATAGLSGTGAYIWWRKRAARRAVRAPAPAQVASSEPARPALMPAE